MLVIHSWFLSCYITDQNSFTVFPFSYHWPSSQDSCFQLFKMQTTSVPYDLKFIGSKLRSLHFPIHNAEKTYPFSVFKGVRELMPFASIPHLVGWKGSPTRGKRQNLGDWGKMDSRARFSLFHKISMLLPTDLETVLVGFKTIMEVSCTPIKENTLTLWLDKVEVLHIVFLWTDNLVILYVNIFKRIIMHFMRYKTWRYPPDKRNMCELYIRYHYSWNMFNPAPTWSSKFNSQETKRY